MSTFKELRDRVLDAGDLAKTRDAGEVGALVNQSYKEVVALSRCNQKASSSLSLTSGTSTYDVTAAPMSITDLLSIVRIVNGNGDGLQLLEEERFFDIARSPAVGWPRFYTHQPPNRLAFWPTPTTAQLTVTLLYNADPALLVGDSDVPSAVPTWAHDAIALSSLAKALRAKKLHTEALTYMSAAERTIATLAAQTGSRAQEGGPPAWLTATDLEDLRRIQGAPR